MGANGHAWPALSDFLCWRIPPVPSVQGVAAGVTSFAPPRLPAFVGPGFARMTSFARAGQVIPGPRVAPVIDAGFMVNFRGRRDPARGAVFTKRVRLKFGRPQALPPGCRIRPFVHRYFRLPRLPGYPCRIHSI